MCLSPIDIWLWSCNVLLACLHKWQNARGWVAGRSLVMSAQKTLFSQKTFYTYMMNLFLFSIATKRLPHTLQCCWTLFMCRSIHRIMTLDRDYSYSWWFLWWKKKVWHVQNHVFAHLQAFFFMMLHTGLLLYDATYRPSSLWCYIQAFLGICLASTWPSWT